MQWPRRHHVTVDDYHRISEAGLLNPQARLELIEGEIVDMPPIGSRHAGKASRLADLLRDAVGEHALIRTQWPVRLGRQTEVQPDIAVVKPRADYYESAHPAPGDVLLLVEVSDSTLRHDLDVKADLYARHGIREFWVLDLPNNILHVFTHPVNGAYSEQRSHMEPSTVPLSRVPGAKLENVEECAIIACGRVRTPPRR